MLQWPEELCWQELKLLVWPTTPGSSKGRGTRSKVTGSPTLGVGCEAFKHSPEIHTVMTVESDRMETKDREPGMNGRK
jgi:hypothetical protein